MFRWSFLFLVTQDKKTLILNQLSRTAVLYIRSKILSPLFGIYCTFDLKKNGKMLLETRCEFYGFFLKHTRKNTNNCWHLLDEIRETAGYFWTFSLEINIQTWDGPQISLPQNCVLCPFPMILRCSVPSPRLWGGPDVPEDSRRFLTVTVNSESGSGLAGGVLFALWGPSNLQPALQTDTLTAAIDAVSSTTAPETMSNPSFISIMSSLRTERS